MPGAYRAAVTIRDGTAGEWALDWASSGAAALTGRPDGPPLLPPGNAATAARKLADDLRTATGGRVDVDGPALLAERAAFTGHRRAGARSVGGSCRLLPTADGWAAVSCARPDDPLLLGALVERDLPADPWPTLAAWLREHSGSELAERAELLGVAANPVGRPARLPRWPILPPRPVEGLLVVDFSALWAGPLCAHLLGLAGARVVKVETPARPDGGRFGHAGFYQLLHAGHRSVVLDPADPDGRRALAVLVEAADIVIEASRPRALAGFGLDAHAAVANGTTWVSITADGRASNRIGFGDDVAAGAGLLARDARGPVFCVTSPSPMSRLTSSTATTSPLGPEYAALRLRADTDSLRPPVCPGCAWMAVICAPRSARGRRQARRRQPWVRPPCSRGRRAAGD